MVKYTSTDELISELRAKPFFKDNPNLIDEATIYRLVFFALRAFGTNVMTLKEEVVSIDDFRGDLPSDFGRLSLAVFCKTSGYNILQGSKDHLMGSYIWTEKLERGECSIDNACDMEKGKCIVERHYFNDGAGEVEIYYSNPQYVKIGRGVLNGGCTDNCVNRSVKNSPYAIDIMGTKIQANFRKGKIFLEYYGLPQDEDGVPIIPNTKYGHLERYIEKHVFRQLLEDAMYSKDATNLQGMYQITLQQERELQIAAMKDVESVGMITFIKAIDENRRRRNSFQLNLGLN